MLGMPSVPAIAQAVAGCAASASCLVARPGCVLLVAISCANICITNIAQWMMCSLGGVRPSSTPNRLGNAHRIGVSAIHPV